MTDTDNLSRRRFLQGTGAAATAAALAGCTGDGGTDDTTTTEPTEEDPGTDTEETTTTETSTIDTSKTIRGATTSTMSTLDPINATDTTSGAFIQNIFDALTNYPNGQTNVENLLASGLETSNNGETLTFTLKEGVTYNNGTEVTAPDLVYSFERLAQSDNSRRTSFILSVLGVEHETETTTVDGEETEQYVPGSIAVTAEGDYTLSIDLDGPFYAATSMLAYTSFSAIPEGLLGDIEGYEGRMDYQEFSTSNPVGSGAYTLETWNQGSETALAARDSYHAGEIMNAGRTNTVFNEVNPAYTYATVNVNADFPVIPSAQYDPELVNIEGTDDRGRAYGTYGPMENDLTADYYEVASLSTYYISFNCEEVPKPVRQAVAYTFSQQTTSEQILAGPDKPAYHFTPPALFAGGPGNYEEEAQDYKYGYQTTANLDQAIQVMEDAGYSSDNQFNLTFNMPSGSASSWGQDLFTLLRDQLVQAHINLELQSADWSTFLNTGQQGNFEMYYLGWLADYPGADNFLQLCYPPQMDTSSDSFVAYSNWNEDNGDYAQQAIEGWEIIQDNYATGQAEARAEGIMMMEEAVMEDAVYVPMIHGIGQHMKYPWVEMPRIGAMGSSRAKDHKIGIGDRGEHE